MKRESAHPPSAWTAPAPNPVDHRLHAAAGKTPIRSDSSLNPDNMPFQARRAMTRWTLTPIRTRTFPIACPLPFLSDTPSFDHGTQLPTTTERSKRSSLLVESRHRDLESCEGGDGRGVSKGRFQLCQRSSHYNWSEFPVSPRHLNFG